MIVVEGRDLQLSSANIWSFDLEWTKNYSVKNGSVPFCFSLVFFSDAARPSSLEERLKCGFVSYYIEHPEEVDDLVRSAVESLHGTPLQQSTLVGHQLSSDLGVLASKAPADVRGMVATLRRRWHERKTTANGRPAVFDSRYDLLGLEGTSRRLVDVCCEYNMDVRQPELSGSMTAMQRTFLECADPRIYERLAVLNLRHSLSAALLYYFAQRGQRPRRTLNVNRIIHRMLRGHFAYLRTAGFKELLR